MPAGSHWDLVGPYGMVVSRTRRPEGLADLTGTVEPDQEAPSAPRRVAPDYPKGWEPSVTWDGNSGEVCSGPLDTPIGDATDWDPILSMLGYDPAKFFVDDTNGVTSKTWFMGYKDSDGAGTRLQLWSYKARVRLRSAMADDTDLAALIDEIRRHKPTKPVVVDTDLSMVVAVSDLQVGKADGDGTVGTVARFLAMVDQVTERLRELRKLGRPVRTLVVAGMGDLVEGCNGAYAQQTFTVELDRREQVKVVRRLLVHAIKTWAKHAENVVVTTVGGNHGEFRDRSKSFTTFADNDDVAVFEMVAEVLAENPEAYGHIKFNIPRGELVRTLDISGTVVAFTHGHAAKSAGVAAKTMWNWWQKQAMGVQAAGDASILVSGHYHQLNIIEQQGRTLFICPPLDGGSEWFTNQAGLASKPGTLTFLVGPTGWSDMAVLSGRSVKAVEAS